MLVLSRRVGEEIVIAGDIRIAIVALHGNRVQVGITAPAAVRVDRLEVHARRDGAADQPADSAVTVSSRWDHELPARFG